METYATPKRILIISQTITEAERLVQAVQPQVQVVWYDPRDTLSSLQTRIQEAMGETSQVKSIALVEHGGTGLRPSPLWDGLEESGSEVHKFWRWLGQKLATEGRGLALAGGHLDILNFGLAHGAEEEELLTLWEQDVILEELEDLIGHRVAGPFDATGNASQDDNSLSEYRRRNVCSLYFTEQLQKVQKTSRVSLTFSGREVSADTAVSTDVGLADLNRDGALDLVFANGLTSTNQVCLGDGAGGFSCVDVSTDTNDSRGVALADLNRDGAVDAVFANERKRNRVCLGDGTGGFSCTDVSADAMNSQRVALADVNRDGSLDAVFANIGQGNQVCLGDGSGGFDSCHKVSSDKNQSYAVALADVNHDGLVDAVFANWNQANRVCLGDGTGGFSCADVSSDTTLSNAVALGDMNRDGSVDAVFANEGGINRVCLGDGLGGFTSCANVSTDIDKSYGLALADVNGDGSLDAVFANANSQQNRICLGDGTGSFSSCANVSDGGNHLSNDGLSVALGDVNGDGSLDVVLANAGQANWVWSTMVTPTSSSTISSNQSVLSSSSSVMSPYSAVSSSTISPMSTTESSAGSRLSPSVANLGSTVLLGRVLLQMAKNSYHSLSTWFKGKPAPMMSESNSDTTLNQSLQPLLASMSAMRVAQQGRLLERRIAGLQAQALKRGADDWYVYGLEDLVSDIQTAGKRGLTASELQSYQAALSDLTVAYSGRSQCSDSCLEVENLQGYTPLFACPQVNDCVASAQLAAAAPATQLAAPTPGN